MNNIRFYREKIGLSQADLGKLIGVSRQTISAWEDGDREPSFTKLLTISKVMKVSIELLLGKDIYSQQSSLLFKADKYPQVLEFRLWVQSFRYCLTRRSYAVGDFCNDYRKYYSVIPQCAKDLINQELQEDVENNRLVGDECDQEEWRSLLQFVQEKKFILED